MASFISGLIAVIFSLFSFPASPTPSYSFSHHQTTPTIITSGYVPSTNNASTERNPVATILSTTTFYLGADNPIILYGAASGLVSLHAVVYLGDPFDEFSVVSTSTIPVINGSWSFAIPAQSQELGSHLICLYPPNDLDYDWHPTNSPLTCKDITIRPAAGVLFLAASHLFGDADPLSGITKIDVAIYPIITVSPFEEGSLAFGTSSMMIASTWFLTISPPLRPGGYEVYLYFPGDHMAPLEQGTWVVH